MRPPKNSKPWLWVTDPWKTLDHPRDTTLRLIEAAAALGQRVFWASSRSIRSENGRILLEAAEIRRDTPIRSEAASLPRARTVSPAAFGQIHYRVDPPVDLAYLHPLQLLEQGAPGRIVNPARSLVLLSEKTLAGSLKGLAPRGLVSSEASRLLGFIAREKTVVLKPLHTAQSKGVLKLSHDQAHEALVESLSSATGGFSRPVQLQQFLPGILEQGELRLWFVDAKLLACARKLPARGQFRIDMDQGGTIEPAKISARHQGRVRKLAGLLRRHGIRLAAIDWIDGWVTDFNITSPGLIVGMEEALGRELAPRIVRALQRPISRKIST